MDAIYPSLLMIKRGVVKRLQGDIDRLSEWVSTWQMESDVEKCTLICFGRSGRKTPWL